MMKKFWLKSILILIIILNFSCSKSHEFAQMIIPPENTEPVKKPQRDTVKLNSKAEEALKFCEKNKFNTDFAILIDMSLHSGMKRFFVYDFKNRKIIQEHLVGHGCGSNNWSGDDSKSNPKFSNKDGSHLSSLGKYKIGERAISEWGVKTKYLMHGLEESNSNALKRFIVFDS